jgi:hypothetical protein
LPPVPCRFDIPSNNQVFGRSGCQITNNAGFNIDAFTHGNLENLSNVYPTAFNLGFEGVGFPAVNPTYKISDRTTRSAIATIGTIALDSLVGITPSWA